MHFAFSEHSKDIPGSCVFFFFFCIFQSFPSSHAFFVFFNISRLNIPHRTKAPVILRGVWQFSGSGCTNSGVDMKYSAVFYIPAEYFISTPELVHPEPENCHTPRRISGALVLCHGFSISQSFSLYSRPNIPCIWYFPAISIIFQAQRLIHLEFSSHFSYTPGPVPWYYPASNEIWHFPVIYLIFQAQSPMHFNPLLQFSIIL